MNTTDQISWLDGTATAAAALIHAHPILTAILVATVCSWTLTAAIKGWIPAGPRRALKVRTLDCVIAFVIAVFLLSGLVPWKLLLGVSLLIGSGSPFAYWGASELLCWKWPQLRKYLALSELAPALPDPPDASDSPNGETPQ